MYKKRYSTNKEAVDKAYGASNLDLIDDMILVDNASIVDTLMFHGALNVSLVHDLTLELVQNAIFLTFVAYDTTKSVLTLAVFLLGLHPSVWRKIVEEQDGVRSRLGDKLTEAVIADECLYLSAVLQETLRLGSISITPPCETTETLIIDGQRIPKGWSVVYGIRQTHKLDVVIYREGGSHMNIMTGFDPDRWLHKDTRPHDYIPFGVRPRSCPGKTLTSAESKVFIATLAQRVEFEFQGSKGNNVKWAPTTVIKKLADGVPVSAVASKQAINYIHEV